MPLCRKQAFPSQASLVDDLHVCQDFACTANQCYEGKYANRTALILSIIRLFKGFASCRRPQKYINIKNVKKMQIKENQKLPFYKA